MHNYHCRISFAPTINSPGGGASFPIDPGNVFLPVIEETLPGPTLDTLLLVPPDSARLMILGPGDGL
jgi:hypothetical protein